MSKMETNYQFYHRNNFLSIDPVFSISVNLNQKASIINFFTLSKSSKTFIFLRNFKVEGF